MGESSIIKSISENTKIGSCSGRVNSFDNFCQKSVIGISDYNFSLLAHDKCTNLFLNRSY